MTNEKNVPVEKIAPKPKPRKRPRISKRELYESLGMVRVVGARGGVYYE